MVVRSFYFSAEFLRDMDKFFVEIGKIMVFVKNLGFVAINGSSMHIGIFDIFRAWKGNDGM